MCFFFQIRYRRDDPPLDEELLRNEAIAYLKKQRSQDLLEEEIKEHPELAEGTEASPIHSSFPIYKDMETSPGSMNIESELKRIKQIDAKNEVRMLTDHQTISTNVNVPTKESSGNSNNGCTIKH